MKAVIIGAGAQGRVALDLLKCMSEFDEFEFLDDDKSKWGTSLNDTIIAGALGRIADYDKNIFKALLAFGNPTLRRKLASRADLREAPFLNAIHPSAYVAGSATMKDGNTICAQAILNSNAVIGKHVLINNAAVVEHDSILEDYTTVCPGALVGGRVELAEGAFICSGAVILPRIKVGKYSVLAAGSVLTRDLGDNVLAMGSPAKIVREIGENFDWRRLL